MKRRSRAGQPERALQRAAGAAHAPSAPAPTAAGEEELAAVGEVAPARPLRAHERVREDDRGQHTAERRVPRQHADSRPAPRCPRSPSTEPGAEHERSTQPERAPRSRAPTRGSTRRSLTTTHARRGRRRPPRAPRRPTPSPGEPGEPGRQPRRDAQPPRAAARLQSVPRGVTPPRIPRRFKRGSGMTINEGHGVDRRTSSRRGSCCGLPRVRGGVRARAPDACRAERAAWEPASAPASLLVRVPGASSTTSTWRRRGGRFPSPRRRAVAVAVPAELRRDGRAGAGAPRRTTNASLWLDALIGGSAWRPWPRSSCCRPIFEPVLGEGWETAARLAYPLADLLLTGFAVVLWGAGRWRARRLARARSRVRADRRARQRRRARPDGGRLDPGSLPDIGFAAGSMAVAVAAWRSQPQQARRAANTRVVLPITFTVASFALVCYEALPSSTCSPSP